MRLVHCAQIAALLFAGSCSTAAGAWRADLKKQAQQAFAQQTYALTRSYYFSEMYGDNERWLLSERPSDEVSHRIDLRGEAIHPQPAVGIVATGEAVVLESIEFPHALSAWHRMLDSPISHIWLKLRWLGASNNAMAGAHPKRPFTIVLPEDVDSPAALRAAISAVLQPPPQVHAWLFEQPLSVRTAIKHKTMVLGMSEQALLAAMGEPTSWRSALNGAGQPCRIARYAQDEAWLRAGVVTHIATNENNSIKIAD